MSMQSSDHSSTYNANISACIVSAFVILCSSFCYCKASGDIDNMCVPAAFTLLSNVIIDIKLSVILF
ncbi:MAG TPA: hypothetical protein VHJ38_14130 [Nitrososphaeraceae archaeon]|jgi:hypothetical protein|nr:hypothetical protein [Nitrososphaeraceae archaeon]